LRALILLLIPAGIGLGLMGEEIIAVALQRGQFASTDTLRAAAVLRGYALGLFSVGAFTFLQRAFYACDDYRTPLRVAAITMVIDVSLSVILKETSLRVVGLAVANSVAFTIGLLLYARPLLRTVARMRDANRGEARVATTSDDIDKREIDSDSVAAERDDPVRSSRTSVRRVPALIRALGVALAGSLTAVLAVLVMRSLFDLAGADSWRVAESSLRTLLLLLGESIAALSALGAMYRIFGVSPRALVRGR
jgi:putative peptidoglycan lipid II flippase